MKRERTSHSDLANRLDDLAATLTALPQGFVDAPSIKLVTDVAQIVYEQDRRIDEMNVALRGNIADWRAALAKKGSER